MNGGIRVFVVFVVAVSLVGVLGPDVLAQAPSGQTALQTDPYYADYVDTLAYWFEYNHPDDWEARLSEALIEAPDQHREEKDDSDMQEDLPDWVKQIPGSERVVLTGLPADSWWIDIWRQDLNGAWSKIPSWRPADQLPSPVSGDVMINGKLPAPLVIRVCDKSGAVLLDGPKLMVVSWTNGGGGTWPQRLDVPSLPEATEQQVDRLPW